MKQRVQLQVYSQPLIRIVALMRPQLVKRIWMSLQVSRNVILQGLESKDQFRISLIIVLTLFVANVNGPFQTSILISRYHCLEYSVVKGAAYCYICGMFGLNLPSSEEIFIKLVFDIGINVKRDWINMKKVTVIFVKKNI